ncbi:hypothetical protein LF1_20800 [Rubripirellula obstinata]|uniref:Uncharacterized protein n=1 Tax=Rubripirellula obstinata TaxID=406547 RepID=A0A5B1CG65_9BACT|nr:hypothetical protein [Rubripirellula obstinata]KAA1259546.1 hypothetical protein LF1_20800 [Rubripirellula obstinata]
MWWLDSEERIIPARNRSLPPTPSNRPAVPDSAIPTSNQPVAKRRVSKCVSPLIDTLTPEQEQANRVLSQVQCGHEVEIERLLADVGALEKAVRQAAIKSESQQATIEQKEALLRSAEESAESLQCTLTEFDGEVQRLGEELQLGENTQAESQQKYEQQIAHCEYRTMFAEHRLAELATVIQHQLEKHQQHCDQHAQAIADKDRQLALLDGISGQWQRQAFAYRAQSERLTSETQHGQIQITAMHAQLTENESELCRKDQEIAELMPSRDQLANAEKRAATWQLETQRSHASRRDLAEQMRRERAVDDEARKQADLQREQLEQKHRVAQLRVQRLRSENSQLNKQLQRESRGRVVDRRIRESETSDVQSSVRAKAIQVEQLQASVERRDREIINLKDAIAATQVELVTAWDCSKEAANHLQLRDAELKHARENEERFVQIQADQARSLQSRIDSLVNQLDTLQNEFDAERESSRIDLEGFERLLSDLEGVIEQLGFDQEQLRSALDLAHQTNTSLLNQAAKSRAQLSGGRAKGVLLIERYEQRLRQAIQTIETLKNRTRPESDEGRRAA